MQYLEGYVRARRILADYEAPVRSEDEIVIRRPIGFRVGFRLVVLGSHLMGVEPPTEDPRLQPAA